MSGYVGIGTSTPERESAPEGRKGSSLMVGEGKVGSGGGVENGECGGTATRSSEQSPIHPLT